MITETAHAALQRQIAHTLRTTDLQTALAALRACRERMEKKR